MVRGLVFLVFLVFSLYANNVDTKIESFLGKKEFYIQKNLIDILFEDKSSYLDDKANTDDVKILAKLKASGLLKLFYSNPVKMELSFVTNENSLIFMRVVNEALEAMGYSYFITKKVIQKDGKFEWDITLSTEHVVDPVLFARELDLRGCKIIGINKDGEYNWNYFIDSSKIKINALELEENTTIALKKPIKAYWINVENTTRVSIRSKLADRWHPSVVFYDKSLNIISYYKKDEVIEFVKLDVPKNARYLKIEDVYTLDNIKRGLSLYLYSRN